MNPTPFLRSRARQRASSIKRPRAWLVGSSLLLLLTTTHCSSSNPSGPTRSGDSPGTVGDDKSDDDDSPGSSGSPGTTKGDGGKVPSTTNPKDAGKGPAKGDAGGGNTTTPPKPGSDNPVEPVPPDGPTAVDTTKGRWRTARDEKTGRFTFISPDDQPAVLRGISMTGPETGTRETAAGGGFWLYLSNQMPEATNAPKVLANVVNTLVTKWKTDVVRIPICGSAWTQNYVVRDWSNAKVATYRDWVDVAVKAARDAGKVVIIDNHLWAIGKMGNGGNVDRGSFTSNGKTHKYSEYEDGCTGINKVGGTDSCAPKDWFVENPAVWQCAIANADGVTMHNAYKNKDNIKAMWADVAARYKNDDGVWFELFNEPYSR
ncbi:MAG: hypothetical protein RLZZ450_2631, partial [Pseudomonadota bacterium]